MSDEDLQLSIRAHVCEEKEPSEHLYQVYQPHHYKPQPQLCIAQPQLYAARPQL